MREHYPWLQTTFELLDRAFPDGISDEDFLPTLAILHSFLCAENLCIVFAEFGRNANNDVLRVGERRELFVEGLEPTLERLCDAGFRVWSRES